MTLRSVILLIAAVRALPASTAPSSFLLGPDYSEWLVPNVTRILTDKDGAIYVLSSFPFSGNTPPSTVTKLSPDGKTLVWQNKLNIAVTTMAVDAGGGVYVTPLVFGGPISVAKLNAGGSDSRGPSLRVSPLLSASPHNSRPTRWDAPTLQRSTAKALA